MSRGRPQAHQGEKAQMIDSLDQIEKDAQARIKSEGRINIAPTSKLDWRDKEEGFTYIWASNSEGFPVTLQQRLEAGYTIVRHKHGKTPGEPVIKNSKGCNLYLIRIPDEYYQEDERIKQQKSLSQVQEINNKVGAREYAGDSKELGQGKVATHKFEESPDAVDLMGDQ